MPRVLIAHGDEAVCHTLAGLTNVVRPDAIIDCANDGVRVQVSLSSRHYDLVVAEAAMSFPGGLQVAMVAEEAGVGICVALVANHPTADSLADGACPRITQFISHPFNPKRYRCVVQESLERCPVGSPALPVRIDDWLKARLSQCDLHVADACREFQISRSHLYRIFTGDIGMSFHRRLAYHRITRGKELMLQATSRLLLKRIATDCGYKTPARFSEAFKRYQGMSPSSYLEHLHDGQPMRDA